MALNATRLANAVYNTWTADTARNGFSAPLDAEQQLLLRSMVEAFAVEILAELIVNGVVTVTTAPGTGTIS